MEPKTIGTQGVIDLCAWRMITCSSQKTLKSYDKVNSTSLFGYDAQRKKIEIVSP